MFFFLYWFFPDCPQLSQPILKNLNFEFPKNMIITPLTWLMHLTWHLGGDCTPIPFRIFWDHVHSIIQNFRAVFRIFKKGHFLWSFTQKFLKIMLLLAKRALFWEILLRAASDYRMFISSWLFPNIAILNLSPTQHLRWSSLWWKIGYSWKLLLTVLT